MCSCEGRRGTAITSFKCILRRQLIAYTRKIERMSRLRVLFQNCTDEVSSISTAEERRFRKRLCAFGRRQGTKNSLWYQWWCERPLHGFEQMKWKIGKAYQKERRCIHKNCKRQTNFMGCRPKCKLMVVSYTLFIFLNTNTVGFRGFYIGRCPLKSIQHKYVCINLSISCQKVTFFQYSSRTAYM